MQEIHCRSDELTCNFSFCKYLSIKMCSLQRNEKKIFQDFAPSKRSQQMGRDFDSPFKANSLLAQVKWLFVFFCKVKERVEVLGLL